MPVKVLIPTKIMKKILIGGHEQSFKNDLRTLLELDGFQMQEASKPGEALKKVLEEKFDVIVLHLQLDLDNTLSTLAFSAIRMVDRELPVIVITDNAETLSSIAPVVHEAFKHFHTPVDPKEIVGAIKEAINVKFDSQQTSLKG
ncbi:MAG: response regulator [Candidatus Scalindua sp.]